MREAGQGTGMLLDGLLTAVLAAGILTRWLSVCCSTAERLLPGAEFHRYVKGQRSVVRSPLPYAVPEELAEHVEFGMSYTSELRLPRALRAWGVGGRVTIEQPGLAISVPQRTVWKSSSHGPGCPCTPLRM